MPTARTIVSGFAALLILMTAANPVSAQYKNKLSILPIENPAGWTADYAPGELVTRMLKHSVAENGAFHLYPAPKKQAGDKASMNHPAQFLVQGRVLVFDPGEPPTKAQKVFDAPETIKQRAEIEIEIELSSHHAREFLGRQRFQAQSIAGVIPFEFDGTQLDFHDPQFLRTSIGKTLADLNRQIHAFITQTLYVQPLQGEIVGVDKEKMEVLINLGRENGIGFGDDFNVYSVTLNQKDPYSKRDLGGRFTRQGVVRVRQVHAGFSIAAIMAGKEFQQGQLVRSRKTNPVYHPAPSLSPGVPSPAGYSSPQIQSASR